MERDAQRSLLFNYQTDIVSFWALFPSQIYVITVTGAKAKTRAVIYHKILEIMTNTAMNVSYNCNPPAF